MPQNPISTLGASPNGPLTHQDVREKINEVATETNSQNDTLDHFVYNPVTNRLEADVVIQAGLNSVALGKEAWKISSGGVDVSLREEFSSVDHMTVTRSFLPHTDSNNWGASGFKQETLRDYTVAAFGATAGDIGDSGAYDPNNPPAFIDYDGITNLAVNITTFGIKFRIGETLAQGEKLYYNLSFDDGSTRKRIFTQVFEADQAYSIGDYVTFNWSQPASAYEGQSVHAELRKDNEIDGAIFQVYANDTGTRHWNEILSRTFTEFEKRPNGVLDYNDTATTTTPIALQANTWTTITNDGLGPYTNLNFKPYEVTDMMDTTTGEFDFTELQLGVGIFIRNDYEVNPNIDKALLEIRYQIGTGAGAYTLVDSNGRLDDGAGKYYRKSLKADYIYTGDANTRDNSISFQVKLSCDGTLINNGSAIQVVNR